jgi:hypothetical protein
MLCVWPRQRGRSLLGNAQDLVNIKRIGKGHFGRSRCVDDSAVNCGSFVLRLELLLLL